MRASGPSNEGARIAQGRIRCNTRRPVTEASVQQPTSPPRQLGFAVALALVVGNMIGSGIFLLPANLAPFGFNAIIGWIFTIGGSICIAAVFSMLARAMPHAAAADDFCHNLPRDAPGL